MQGAAAPARRERLTGRLPWPGLGRLVGLAGGEPGGLGILAGAQQPAALARQRLGARGIAPVEAAVGQVAIDGRDALGQQLDLGFGLGDVLPQRRQRGAPLRRLPARVLRRLLRRAVRLRLGARRIGVGAALGQALGAVLVHVAVVGAHGAAAHDPQAVGAGVHQVAVVADQDHRALVVVERAHQRLARIDVEVVGRLVEDQQVRPVEGRQREQQARLLAAREVLRLGVGLADAEAERAELGAPLRLGGVGHQVEHVLVGRLAGGQVVHLVLGEDSRPTILSEA